MIRWACTVVVFAWLIAGCSKGSSSPGAAPGPGSFKLVSKTLNGIPPGTPQYNINASPVTRFTFSAPVDHNSVTNSFYFKDNAGVAIPYTASYENRDSAIVIQPASALKPITKYGLGFSAFLQSQDKVSLQSSIDIQFTTAIDSTDKFPRLTDSALLTLVQQQTFKYFRDLGGPVSGLARERASGDVVTTGGSGFGIMAILVGIQRNFITRPDALTRIMTLVNFLGYSTKVTRYHGAFSHWLNGTTGATVPFSALDNGGDIVETSYLIQRLLPPSQPFTSPTSPREIILRSAINKLWSGVDWNWYRQGGQNILYWNWSPDHNWAVNVPVKGWNEALITYLLAASAPMDSIPKTTYYSRWALHGGVANGNSFFVVRLPLGPGQGGPLFFAHYSFLGIDPHGLSYAYANYWTQDTAHARITYLYCANNPV